LLSGIHSSKSVWRIVLGVRVSGPPTLQSLCPFDVAVRLRLGGIRFRSSILPVDHGDRTFILKVIPR
jgi:hypothetical protein